LKSQRIVITGGPGTGKTSIIESLTSIGYPCFPELIREFTVEEAQDKDATQLKSNPIVFADDSKDFNTRLLEGRKQQYLESLNLQSDYIFFDRGMPDVLAYMDYFDQTYEEDFINACKLHSYDTVFILPPWEAIFAGDEERYETFEEATHIFEHLNERYSYFGSTPIIVPKDTVTNRVSFIEQSLNKV